MNLADKLDQLARIIPGLSGYLDREACRDTDKTIRLRLAGN